MNKKSSTELLSELYAVYVNMVGGPYNQNEEDEEDEKTLKEVRERLGIKEG